MEEILEGILNITGIVDINNFKRAWFLHSLFIIFPLNKKMTHTLKVTLPYCIDLETNLQKTPGLKHLKTQPV